MASRKDTGMNRKAAAKKHSPEEATNLNYLALRISMERFSRPPEQLTKEEYNAVAQAARDELRLHELILASKEAQHVTVDDSAVRDAFEASVTSFGERAAFDEELEERGLDEAHYKLALARELKVHAVLDWVGNRASEVTDDDLAKVYEKNREKLKTPETRLARHMLITINPDYAENTPAKAEERIKKIRREVLDYPERFGPLAKIHSECPSSLNEGMIGPVPGGALFPVLDKILFTMEEGELSPIAQTEMGYHLIRCEQINPATDPTFEEAAAKLKEDIFRQRAAREKKKFIAELLEARLSEPLDIEPVREDEDGGSPGEAGNA